MNLYVKEIKITTTTTTTNTGTGKQETYLQKGQSRSDKADRLTVGACKLLIHNVCSIFSSAVPSGSGAFQMPTHPSASSSSASSTLGGGGGEG